MKKILYIVLFLISNKANSQTIDSSMNSMMSEAGQYLQGFMRPRDPAKAFTLFMQCATMGNAKAMNAVAVQYKTGLGIDSNRSEALKWFQKSAAKGYAKAWYNLGLMYKYSTPADYTLSYECFSKAVELKYSSAYYAKAYMLYKGLGCEQNYGQAFSLFYKGALSGSSSSMYFLGLCFRNGYGVNANADSARYWLLKARSLNYDIANDELNIMYPENISVAGKVDANIVQASKTASTKAGTLLTYKKVTHSMPSVMEGKYRGYIIKYDYSGRHVLQASKLQLQISCINNNIKGSWLEDDSIKLELNGSLTKKALLFKTLQYRRHSFRNPGTSNLLNFESAQLQSTRAGDSLYLFGDLYLFDASINEPAKPVFISLVMFSPLKNPENGNSFPVAKSNELLVTPNPFSTSFTVSINLVKETEVQISLVNIAGQVVYSNSPVKYKAGKYNLPIYPKVPPGVYVIKVYYNKKAHSILVEKN